MNKEQKACSEGDSNWTDFVDDMVELENSTANEKVCLECGALNGADRHKCRNTECNGALASQEPDFNLILKDKETPKIYQALEEDIPINSNKISVTLARPS